MKYLHRAWAEINLDALVHNFKEIKKSTYADIISIVKANAYGHGVDKVALALDEAGSSAFGVSNIDEAKEIRNLGIQKPILILGYTPAEMADELIKYDITQAVFSYEYANKLSQNASSPLKVHLKLDTGMGRIGFDCRDSSLKGLNEAKELLNLKNLTIEGVFAHFASADSLDESDTDFTAEQYERFTKTVELLEDSGFCFKVKHACNSAATMLKEEAHLTAVRPGIILYGLTPSVGITPTLDLKPVMTFKSVVSMVKEIEKDTVISYGRTFKSQDKMTVATVSAGYADGVPRLLSNKGRVFVKNKFAPIIGRVCMDQFLIDISEIPSVKEGDEVEIFGNNISANEVAKIAQTINYEIVCGVSSRVPRVKGK